MNYAPIVRILLRYVVGAGIIGSTQVGDMLAADSDLVSLGVLGVSCVVGLSTEWWYRNAKRDGGET